MSLGVKRLALCAGTEMPISVDLRLRNGGAARSLSKTRGLPLMVVDFGAVDVIQGCRVFGNTYGTCVLVLVLHDNPGPTYIALAELLDASFGCLSVEPRHNH